MEDPGRIGVVHPAEVHREPSQPISSDPAPRCDCEAVVLAGHHREDVPGLRRIKVLSDYLARLVQKAAS